MEYRIYDPTIDEAAVLELRAKVWGDNHPHNDGLFLRWMLKDTPLGQGTGIVMSKDGQTTGFMGISPRNMMQGGRKYLAGHCMDLMVHPDYRSTLASLKLVNQCLDALKTLNYDFAYGFPNQNSYRLVVSPKCGYRHVYSPLLSIRAISGNFISGEIAPVVPEILRKMAGMPVAALCGLWAMIGSAGKPAGEGVWVEKFDDRFDGIWDQQISNETIGLAQDKSYLNWRFVDNPLYTYRKMAWIQDANVKGYLVTAKRDLFGIPTALIVNSVIADNDFPVFSALVDMAVNQALADGCRLIAVQCLPRSVSAKQLTRLGFIPIPHKLNPKQFNFVLHGLGRDIGEFVQVDSWSFNWCDMDIV